MGLIQSLAHKSPSIEAYKAHIRTDHHQRKDDPLTSRKYPLEYAHALCLARGDQLPRQYLNQGRPQQNQNTTKKNCKPEN